MASADRLAARGLVERHEDTDDRRVKRVVLTSEGTATKGRLVACMESARTPFARLSATQRRQLHDLLPTGLRATEKTSPSWLKLCLGGIVRSSQ